ncbi:MAG: PilN domain-containing protein [Gammaproteobacteria bacterium]|nr:PilN domain-containing protein [Gammaproteobacteria bacterium]
MNINLLPWGQICVERQKYFTKQYLCLVVLLTVFAMFAWRVILEQKIGSVRGLNTKLEQELNMKKTMVQEAMIIKEKAQYLKNLNQKILATKTLQAQSLQILTAISHATFNDAYLIEITKSAGEVTINGKANSITSLVKFLQKILATNFFVTAAVQEIKSNITGAYDFKININI